MKKSFLILPTLVILGIFLFPNLSFASINLNYSVYTPPADPHYTQTGSNYIVFYNLVSGVGICGDVTSKANAIASVDCTYLPTGSFPTSTIGNYSAIEVSGTIGCWSGGSLLSYSACKDGAGFLSEFLFSIASSPTSSASSTLRSYIGFSFELLFFALAFILVVLFMRKI